MKNLLIGSAAIKYWFPDFPRTPKDLDFIGSPSWDGQTIYDHALDIVDFTLRKEYHTNEVFRDYVTHNNIMRPNDLYTLKISHMFWDIKWEKHMFDIQFLKSKGCKLDRELFDKLYDYWNVVHGKNKRSDLKMSAKDFFDNALKEYNHDQLHELLTPVPMYKKVLKDGAEVEVDENKYNQLTYEEKLDILDHKLKELPIHKQGMESLLNFLIDKYDSLKSVIEHHEKIEDLKRIGQKEVITKIIAGLVGAAGSGLILAIGYIFGKVFK